MESLASLLAEDVEIIGLCSHPELTRRLRASGVKTYTFPPWLASKRILRTVLGLLLVGVLTLRLDIDIVHVNGFAEAILLLPVRLFGRRAMSTMHATLGLEAPSFYKQVSRLIYLMMVRAAHRVICVSDSVAQELKQKVPGVRTLVIKNWVQCPTQRPRPSFGARPPVRVLFVGRLERHKGVHVLLDACRGIPGVHVTIVGDGSVREELERQAEGMDVRFAGYQPNPMRFYEEADIFVLPSFGPEGLPLVALEAMANGLPCVLSDLEVHKEITDGGDAAVLFRTGDASDLRQKLGHLIMSESQRRINVDRAHKIIATRHSPEVARAKYAAAFELNGALR